MSFQGQDFRHFPQAGVSLAVDVKNGQARVAMCATNFRHGDKFSRVTARRILSMRLRGDDTSLRAFNIGNETADGHSCVVRFPYNGSKPRNEIIGPLVRKFGAELVQREKSEGAGGSISQIVSVINADAQARREAHHQAQEAKNESEHRCAHDSVSDPCSRKEKPLHLPPSPPIH